MAAVQVGPDGRAGTFIVFQHSWLATAKALPPACKKLLAQQGRGDCMQPKLCRAEVLAMQGSHRGWGQIVCRNKRLYHQHAASWGQAGDSTGVQAVLGRMPCTGTGLAGMACQRQGADRTLQVALCTWQRAVVGTMAESSTVALANLMLAVLLGRGATVTFMCHRLTKLPTAMSPLIDCSMPPKKQQPLPPRSAGLAPPLGPRPQTQPP